MAAKELAVAAHGVGRSSVVEEVKHSMVVPLLVLVHKRIFHPSRIGFPTEEQVLVLEDVRAVVPPVRCCDKVNG